MQTIKKDLNIISFSVILYIHKNKIHTINTAQSNLKTSKSPYPLTLSPFLEFPEFGKCTKRRRQHVTLLTNIKTNFSTVSFHTKSLKFSSQQIYENQEQYVVQKCSGKWQNLKLRNSLDNIRHEFFFQKYYRTGFLQSNYELVNSEKQRRIQNLVKHLRWRFFVKRSIVGF